MKSEHMITIVAAVVAALLIDSYFGVSTLL